MLQCVAAVSLSYTHTNIHTQTFLEIWTSSCQKMVEVTVCYRVLGLAAALCQSRSCLKMVEEPLPDPNTATHCNTLQHTATHCNTLQHTKMVEEALPDPNIKFAT